MQNNNDKQRDTIIEDESWMTPGIILRKARRDGGLSEAEVCSQLGLTGRSLRALESDDLGRLPAAAYVRGYIRRYCDLLDIPAEEVVASYEKLRKEVEGDEEIVEIAPSRKPVWHKYWLWGVVIAVLVVLGFWVLRGVSGSTEASEYHTAPVANTEPLTVRDGVEVQTLSLVFSGNSWVEVVDARRDILLADLRHAGDQLELTGVPPFELRVSKPENVDIHYAERPVKVKSATEMKIARVVIGR